ncbi:MAG: ABC transporter ATP-binding protein [Oscillospiraceae bacterium]
MSPAKAPLLRCQNFGFYYQTQEKAVLQNLNFCLYPGETVVLMGPSGCGKSTLAYCMASLYPEYGGKVQGSMEMEGQNIAALPPNLRAQKVSMMFQNPGAQFCMGTPEDEVLFALENVNYGGSLPARAHQLLGLVGLQGQAKAPLPTLSGGTLQKVVLAAALATGAQLLVLDEPFANIDPAAAQAIAKTLQAIAARQGVTLFIVDHRFDYWAPMATRIMVMNKQGALLHQNLLPGQFAQKRELLGALGLFGLQAEYGPRPPAAQGGPQTALYACGLQAGYGRHVVLQNLSLQIKSGTLTAVMGQNGSGKTTLLWALAGLIKHKGKLQTAGRAGLVFQNPAYQFVTLTVLDEVLYTLAAAAPKGEKGGQRQAALQLLQEFGLAQYAGCSPYMLSQGQQRRLAVLAMLAGNHEILLLDEPTYGQDKNGTVFMMERLAERVGRGLTVLVATHDAALAETYAGRILYMQGGALLQK